MELPGTLTVGTSLATALDLNDVIMDLEITSWSAGVDCYILDENQYSNYESTGVLDYDRNATLFDVDWEMWKYQVLDDGDWYVYIFNS